jgi:glycine oxidase
VKPAYSVAIAGGGIIGLSIAWRLAQNGFLVSVFEKSTMGGESSWAGAGMLAPGGEVHHDSELAALTLEARALYPEFVHELEEATGFSVDLQQAGALDLAYTAEAWAALDVRAGNQAAIGIHSRAIDVPKVATYWPRVKTSGLVGARFYPGDAIVNPRDMVLALCAACRKLGVSLLQNCAVEEAHIHSEQQRVDVKTSQGVGSYDALVIAAGAWSASIPVTGVPPPPRSEPVRGHLIGYQQPEHTCSTIVRSGDAYFLQRANGLLIAGASMERVGFDRRIDAATVSALKLSAAAVFEHLGETEPSEVWLGFRPASDALRTGRWQTDSLYLAYGHFRNGILLAPLTARQLSSEISANLRTR